MPGKSYLFRLEARVRARGARVACGCLLARVRVRSRVHARARGFVCERVRVRMRIRVCLCLRVRARVCLCVRSCVCVCVCLCVAVRECLCITLSDCFSLCCFEALSAVRLCTRDIHLHAQVLKNPMFTPAYNNFILEYNGEASMPFPGISIWAISSTDVLARNSGEHYNSVTYILMDLYTTCTSLSHAYAQFTKRVRKASSSTRADSYFERVEFPQTKGSPQVS